MLIVAFAEPAAAQSPTEDMQQYTDEVARLVRDVSSKEQDTRGSSVATIAGSSGTFPSRASASSATIAPSSTGSSAARPTRSWSARLPPSATTCSAASARRRRSDHDSMLHVLNGDETQRVFERAGIAGDVVVWRDILVEGPVSADGDAVPAL